MEESLEDKWDALLFGVRRSVRYHERRRHFFDSWNRVTSAISVVFGSAAIATLLEGADKIWTVAAALAVTITSTVDLVVGTARQSWVHADLAKQFIDLEQEIVGSPATERNLIKYTSKRLEIEKEEPPVKRVLDIIAHNDMIMSDDRYDEDDMFVVPPFKRLFANVFDMEVESLRRKKEFFHYH